MCFMMNDDRLKINLSLFLIIVFNLFRDERGDSNFEKNSSLKLKFKSF